MLCYQEVKSKRIAIARALIKRPKILILDEATSALDSKSESLINETLKNLTSQGKITIISIAHRLSTISKSEFVVVLGKNGKVVEHGRFVELFSDPNSELSKLLDESTNKQDEDKIDEEEADEIEHANYEAEKIEQGQRDFGKLEHLRLMIDSLPEELKDQLIEEITLDTKKKIQNMDTATLGEDLRR